MNVCFIVAGMDKRIPFLNECIEAFRKSRYSDCDIYLYFQGEKFSDIQGSEIFTDIVIDREARGVFTPRYELLKRYGKDYDYVIIIDDDLFIQDETDYYATIRFMQKFKNVGCSCITHSRRAVCNRIEIIKNGREYFNIAGGLILSNQAVREILEYFADKERDYTFDCVWILLWIKGYDLAKDFRSWAKHTAARKVNGEWSGFNESRTALKYEPIFVEYLENLKTVFGHGKYEIDLPTIDNVNASGREERRRNREKGFCYRNDQQQS